MTPAGITEEELVAWGATLGRAAGADDAFVALYGELGAGKSTLVRAACRALGVRGAVASPTFSLVNFLEGDGAEIRHADLYRLESPITWRMLVDAGWPDLIEAEGPVFVEWADRAAAWLPPDRWDVRLAVVDEERRAVSIERVGHATEPPALPC